jgi:hypothetical protein
MMRRCAQRVMLPLTMALILLALVPVDVARAQTSVPERADEASPTTQTEESKSKSWYELYQREGLVTLSLVRDDDSLEGFQLGYGIRLESDEWPGWGAISFTRMSHDDQRVTGLRADMMMWPFSGPWCGLGPVLGIGLENRSEPPRSGFGGYLVFGVEVATWTRLHWQFAFDAEYDVGISSESRGQLSLRLAYAHSKLTIGPTHF